MPKSRDPLTEKQRVACRELLTGCTQAEAFVRAGYSGKYAHQNAARLFKRPECRAYLAELRAPVIERVRVTAEMVIEEYAKLAFLDPRRFFDESGNLLPVAKLPADVAAALSGMDVVVERVGEDEDGKPQFASVRKIKFADKRGALDSLARHLGMFKDKLELSLDESLAEQVRRATGRVG